MSIWQPATAIYSRSFPSSFPQTLNLQPRLTREFFQRFLLICEDSFTTTDMVRVSDLTDELLLEI